jgi:Zn-dependent protease
VPTLDEPVAFCACVLVLLLSISLHESAHAYCADALGDSTARSQGRVTLNPLAHLHWLGSIVLPILLLIFMPAFVMGAGKPVPVVRENLRNPARDFMWIAICGPLSNVVLAVVASVLFVLIKRITAIEHNELLYDVACFAIGLNLQLAILNSLPIPPLDGSRILAYLLPRSLQPIFYRIDPIGIIILVVLILTESLRPVFDATFPPLWSWWLDTLTRWLV